MGEFYKKYVALCNAANKSPSAVAIEIGLSKTAVHGWKTGRSNPTDATVQKVANYFNVTVEYLTTERQKELTANNGELSEREKANLVFSDLSDEEIEKVLDYIAFIKSKRIEE